MAAPHSAGVAAQYLQGNPKTSPATVTKALKSLSTKKKIKEARGSTPCYGRTTRPSIVTQGQGLINKEL